ncbi:MAG: hypothetical protein ACFFHV_12620 [Promethearchaeota archaeon]
MDTESWRVKAYKFQVVGAIISVILIIIAMAFYTGGTPDNPSIQGYSFWDNTLSNLGMSVAYSGKSNTISMILFSIALIFSAASLIPFYLAIRFFFTEVKREKWLSNIGTIFGIITSISIIGIAISPVDILEEQHMLFVYISYTSTLIMSFCFSISMYLNKEFPKQYAYIFFIFTAVNFILSIMGLVGLASNRALMVIAQKVGWIAQIVCFVILSYGCWKLVKL